MIGFHNSKRVWPVDQAGTIFLFTLLVTSIISVLAMAIISKGLMDFKISLYDAEAQQARMACDAGVDWVTELIYVELNQTANLTADELPTMLNCGNQSMSYGVQNDWCNVSVGTITQQISSGPGTCLYEFTITSTFTRATKKTLVQTEYAYEGGYTQLDGEGNNIFVPRQFINRGNVVGYCSSY